MTSPSSASTVNFIGDLPIVGDRKFNFLVDVTFQETCSVCGLKSLLGQQIERLFGDLDDLTLAFHISLKLGEVELRDLADLVHRERRRRR